MKTNKKDKKQQKAKKQKKVQKPKEIALPDILHTRGGNLYTNHTALSKDINAFFFKSLMHTLPHLYASLGVNVHTMRQMSKLCPLMADVIHQAGVHCELWAIEGGFEEDKSFAKWYLQNYHPTKAEEEETTTDAPHSISISVIQE